jgi:hypothetical protein
MEGHDSSEAATPFVWNTSDSGRSRNLSPATSLDDDSPTMEHIHAFALENYIPIGCISYSDRADQPDIETFGWIEVHHLPEVFLFPAIGLKLAVEKLLNAQWIRIFSGNPFGRVVLRVYVLPDDIGNSTIDRSSKYLRSALATLLSGLDTSKKLWNGNPEPIKSRRFDLWATPLKQSMFYLFNILPSPWPSASNIRDPESRFAVRKLLGEVPDVAGLKTKLYGYQARSVAAMIEREAAPKLNLDPRFEPRKGPARCEYYYNARDTMIRKEQPKYEGNRGGILAENMGVG